VVAAACMVSEANRKAIEASRYQFTVGEKISDLPYVVAQWRRWDGAECRWDTHHGDEQRIPT
jgi:hypothetical protein